MSKDNGNAGYSTWEERTHALEEMLSPALLLPRQLCGAFQSDKELALEVKEFIEIWEQKMDRVLVHEVRLRK